MTAPTPEPAPLDRALLVEVRRWARANGWWLGWSGWHSADGSTVVDWTDGRDEITVRRNGATLGHDYPVANVRQAVDILCALDILPPQLSSAYRTAQAELAKVTRERDSLARRCALRYEETEKLRAELERLRPAPVEPARTEGPGLGDTVAWMSVPLFPGNTPERYEGTVTAVADDGVLTVEIPQDGAPAARVPAPAGHFTVVTRAPRYEPVIRRTDGSPLYVHRCGRTEWGPDADGLIRDCDPCGVTADGGWLMVHVFADGGDPR